MSYTKRLSVTVTTDGSGNATVDSDYIDFGYLEQIKYVKTDFANGVDFTITTRLTGETLWAEANVDADAVRAPRQAVHTTAGAAALYASGGSAVLDKIAIAGDQIRIAIANGGAVKTGTFHFVIG